MSCCSTEPQPEQAKNDFTYSGGDDCCVSSSTYFSVPLYRLNSIRDLSFDFDIALFPSHIVSSRIISATEKPEPDYKPPADVFSFGNDILITTGLLLI
jgi:hypothetical protein